jgi:hypothetical protein
MELNLMGKSANVDLISPSMKLGMKWKSPSSPYYISQMY